MQLNDLKMLKRFKDIVGTLTQYGFDEIVQRLDIPGSDIIRKIRPVDEQIGTYERIRLALEDLGPTFIKFGQIISLRPDLLPEDLLDELEKLQDEVPAFDFDDVEAVVEESLGKPLQDIFSIFDVDPIAAASLSQVHRAVLRQEGHIVAVKIQRPGIVVKIKSDLDILESICRYLEQKFDDLKGYNLTKLVEITRRHLLNEIDFKIEMRNIKIARAHALETNIHIPEVYETYCSKKVLVMEFVQGVKFKDITADSLLDSKHLARQGLMAAVKQILEDGFFHADPHPGNLLVKEDNTLSIIDWGMVGRITQKDRFELTDLFKAIVEKDSDALLHSLLRLCRPTAETIQDRALERDLLDILDDYYAVPIKDMDIGQLLVNITSLIREYRLNLPADLLIMIKALVTAEGSARLAYPELDVVSEVKETISRIAAQRFKPEIIWRKLRNSLSGIWAAQREMPRKINNIIAKLDSGDLGLHFHLEKLEMLINSLENTSNRLTVGIITGSIIIGSSMIVTTGVGPYLFGFPALGVIGYLLSVVLGLWLVITILRTKKY